MLGAVEVSQTTTSDSDISERASMASQLGQDGAAYSLRVNIPFQGKQFPISMTGDESALKLAIPGKPGNVLPVLSLSGDHNNPE
jgi:hypothetical protein